MREIMGIGNLVDDSGDAVETVSQNKQICVNLLELHLHQTNSPNMDKNCKK